MRFNMTSETDEELYLRLKRWGKMSSRDIQKEVLLERYQTFNWEDNGKNPAELDYDWPYYKGKKITRVAEHACPNCGDNVRTPCRITQYLETCLGCGNRIGDTPKGI